MNDSSVILFGACIVVGCCRARRAKGVNRSTFYSFFPSGLAEVCKAAGVPVPERSKQTLKALSARKKEQQVQKEAPCPTRLLLTEEQTRRILGISHMERGKDPSIIMNELFDRDASLRKTYKLSFKDTKNVADFLEVATKEGWKLSWLLSIMAKLWNFGFTHMDQHSLKCLFDMLTEMKSGGLTSKELVETLCMKQGEFEQNIQQAYDAGFRNGLETFENAYVKSVVSISKDYDTLRWLYEIGNLAKLQAQADAQRLQKVPSMRNA